jgi:hypothetical protein
LEFLAPHWGPAVSLYDRLHALPSRRIEEVWPITARREPTAT